MKCWICDDEAKSGEHIIKASDLKAVFPNVSQKKPLFLRVDKNHGSIKAIGSIKNSRQLKSNILICLNCNNVKTAPHDLAWEKLSKYLREKKPLINVKDIIKLNKVFPGKTKKSMLDVHLFFLKLFGCAIKEQSVPINIDSFSKAIICQKPHPLVHLTFAPAISFSKKLVGVTKIKYQINKGECVYATWFYIIDTILVKITYAREYESRKGLIYSWHPTTITKQIHIGQV
jgi:hypothetical protein